MTSRRTFLRSAGAVGTIGLLAGCSQDGGGNGGDGESGGSTDTDGSGGESTEMDTETATSTPTPFGNGEIDFNVSPSVAQERLEEQYAPIRDYLSNELGYPANMNLANNYSAVVQALGSGTSDVAETGPFAAALGVMDDRAEIILQRKGYGTWTYISGIATAPDSDIEELSQLEGKTVAFADRLSTSGALYPLYNISTEGGLEIGNLPEGSGMNADFEAVFTGGHTASFETLSAGQADAAAMGGFVPGIVDNWDSNARWIQQQEGLPRAPIVVSPQLSEENKNAIQQTFLDAPAEIYLGADGEEGTEDDLWFNDVREATVDEYQSVIDVANELGVGTEIFEQ